MIKSVITFIAAIMLLFSASIAKAENTYQTTATQLFMCTDENSTVHMKWAFKERNMRKAQKLVNQYLCVAAKPNKRFNVYVTSAGQSTGVRMLVFSDKSTYYSHEWIGLNSENIRKEK